MVHLFGRTSSLMQPTREWLTMVYNFGWIITCIIPWPMPVAPPDLFREVGMGGYSEEWIPCHCMGGRGPEVQWPNLLHYAVSYYLWVVRAEGLADSEMSIHLQVRSERGLSGKSHPRTMFGPLVPTCIKRGSTDLSLSVHLNRKNEIKYNTTCMK